MLNSELYSNFICSRPGDGIPTRDSAPFSSYERLNEHSSLCTLGGSRALVMHSLEVTPAREGKPNEGIFSLSIENGDPEDSFQKYGSVIQPFMDKCYRDSRFIDLESLCIFPSRAVWSLSVTIFIVDPGVHDVEAASVGLVAHLHSVKVPCTRFDEDGLTIFPCSEKLPSSIKLFYIPLCVSVVSNYNIKGLACLSGTDVICCLSCDTEAHSTLSLSYNSLRAIYDKFILS